MKNTPFQVIKNNLWIHLNGQTRVISLEGARKRTRHKTDSNIASDEIVAPMPGKIIKLFKQKGDSVNKGESVLVMEAMKMEYTLKADLSGIIASIDCILGEQVVLGKSLVKINPKEDQ